MSKAQYLVSLVTLQLFNCVWRSHICDDAHPGQDCKTQADTRGAEVSQHEQGGFLGIVWAIRLMSPGPPPVFVPGTLELQGIRQ